MKRLNFTILLSAAIAALAAAPALAGSEDMGEYSAYGISLSESDITEGVKGWATLAPMGVLSRDPYVSAIGLLDATVPSEKVDEISEDPDSADPEFVESVTKLVGYSAYALITDASLEDAVGSVFNPEYVDQFTASAEEAASENGYHYYYLAVTDYDVAGKYTSVSEEHPDAFPAEELESWVEDAAAAQNNFKEALKNSEHFVPQEPEDAYVGQTLSFETTDVDGNPVSSADLFAENEITMVNLWGTWCPACMSEMEELAAIHKEFREKGCGIVGIEMEYSWDDEIINASKETIKENGIEYPNVKMPSDNELLNGATMYPTSLFVDKDGTILASPIVGADPDSYRATLESLLAGKEEAQPEEESAEEAATDAAEETAEVAEGSADEEAAQYTILVTDEAGAPVEGAVIQFCNADSCYLGTTDADGAAVFEQPEMVYEVHVLQAPEGYKQTEEVFHTTDKYGKVTVVLEKE